ncbi:hypothetical protein BH11MYX4_BH11MYX4_24100 [soil metagenome]
MTALRTLPAFLALAAVVSCTALAACQEPASPDVGLTKAVSPPQPPDLGRGASRAEVREFYHIWLAEAQDVCKGPPPFFEFDSAKADGDEQPTMQTLATCMVSGPLKGRSIRLIGHTDPRGSANYNDKLGLQRAEQVKRYLTAHGVDPARVAVESAGEGEASKAPAEWPKDRRVEIRLAP